MLPNVKVAMFDSFGDGSLSVKQIGGELIRLLDLDDVDADFVEWDTLDECLLWAYDIHLSPELENPMTITFRPLIMCVLICLS